jgi:hypothetical protein
MGKLVLRKTILRNMIDRVWAALGTEMDRCILCLVRGDLTKVGVLSSYPRRLLAGKTLSGKTLNGRGSFYGGLQNCALTEDFPPYP